MLPRSRFALAIGFTSLSLLVYACKEESTSTPDPDAGTTDDGGNMNGDDGGDPSEAGDLDGGTEGGDGEAPLETTCEGNPLSMDPGSDAGVTMTSAELRTIATGPFLDGPQWVDDAIVYSEVNAQAVVRNGGDGGTRLAIRELGAGNLPIGNAFSGGFLFTAMATTTGTGSILRSLVDGGDPQTFPTPNVNSPNDIVASKKGIVYFTDPAFQAQVINPATGVYRINADGTGLAPIEMFDGGGSPGARADGIALSSDETSLFVGFYDARRITKYTLDGDGNASNPVNLPFTPADNPTGIAVDVGGNLWVAESDAVATNLRGRVEVIDGAGQRLGEITFADARPTGIAFGGADGKTVYITTERDLGLGTLYAYTSRCAGVR